MESQFRVIGLLEGNIPGDQIVRLISYNKNSGMNLMSAISETYRKDSNQNLTLIIQICY